MYYRVDADALQTGCRSCIKERSLDLRRRHGTFIWPTIRPSRKRQPRYLSPSAFIHFHSCLSRFLHCVALSLRDCAAQTDLLSLPPRWKLSKQSESRKEGRKERVSSSRGLCRRPRPRLLSRSRARSPSNFISGGGRDLLPNSKLYVPSLK